MSEIKLERNHALGVNDARQRLTQIEPMLRERYGVSLVWRGNDADIEGKGVSGTVVISDGRVTINLRLGLLLRPLAGKIKDALARQVERALA